MAESDVRHDARTEQSRRSNDGEELTPTEARQGEIVVGRRGQILWIVFFTAVIIALLLFGLWALA